jgi:hypothetical protein
MPESRLKKRLCRWRVRAGLIGTVLVIILAKPDLSSLITGLAVSLPGLLLRTWAAGHLKKDKELTVSGPYKYSRNPLYLGNLIIGLGIIIASRSLWVFGIFIVYFLLFYPLIIQVEAEKMKKLFLKEYEAYAKKTPVLFPYKRPFSTVKKNRFRGLLFRKNKEWRALIGTVLLWLVLLGKYLFL